MIYFTADGHFSHKKIMTYQDRPFDSVEEMDEEMIRRWNNKVTNRDHIYILGDLFFGKGADAENLIERLNGKKYLVIGNHDSFVNDDKFNKKLFVWIKDYHSFYYKETKFILFHYPIQVWDCKHHGAIHLYGHVHKNPHPELDRLGRAYNVGVDVNNFEPISINEIISKFNK